MTLEAFIASLSYGRLRSLLVECGLGLAVTVPHDYSKRTLVLTAQRWLTAAEQPVTRKRDAVSVRQRSRAVAGIRLRKVMERRGVEWSSVS